MNYCYGKGVKNVSFVGRLSHSRRVLYRRFHCTLSYKGASSNGQAESGCGQKSSG